MFTTKEGKAGLPTKETEGTVSLELGLNPKSSYIWCLGLFQFRLFSLAAPST